MNIITKIEKNQDETIDEFLFRLGSMKENGEIRMSWDEVASIMNSYGVPQMTESTWRKRYTKLRDEYADYIEEEKDDEIKKTLKEFVFDVEKQRLRERDERLATARRMKTYAREDAIVDLFKDAISKFDVNYDEFVYVKEKKEKAIYAMLSDIHYGITFDSYGGKYDSDIAKDRILYYANEIIKYGKDCDTCYVSLMGDMISGNIHTTIRIENKENIIEQVVGVSELISEFLRRLSMNFNAVIVNSVDGNHSRLDYNLENVLKGERLDSLIPWYAKAKLENIRNIVFVDNEIDKTIGNFNIFDKTYITVHGDYEKDVKTSAHVIEKKLNSHIDYMLSGHMHVANMIYEDTCYIRNGCVCGSGDEYTMKKRLFSPPIQVCMICSKNGVEEIIPVNLSDTSRYRKE